MAQGLVMEEPLTHGQAMVVVEEDVAMGDVAVVVVETLVVAITI